MGESLKEKNLLPLVAFLVAHAGAFAFSTSLWRVFVDSISLESLLPSGIALVGGYVAVGLLNAQMKAKTKARLVYWRWHDPLPGAEPFDRWAKDDDRINLSALLAAYGPQSANRSERSRKFYELYKSVQNAPQVTDANREFLLFRDAAVIGLFLTAALPIATLFTDSSWAARAAYLVGLLILEAALVRAARLSGERLARNVLALHPIKEV